MSTTDYAPTPFPERQLFLDPDLEQPFILEAGKSIRQDDWRDSHDGCGQVTITAEGQADREVRVFYSFAYIKAEIAAEIAAMSGEELSEAVDRAIEHRGELQAEYGMGAVSLGYDPYQIPPLYMPQTDEFIRQGEARLAELYPPAPAPTLTVAKDDLPF